MSEYTLKFQNDTHGHFLSAHAVATMASSLTGSDEPVGWITWALQCHGRRTVCGPKGTAKAMSQWYAHNEEATK